MSYKFEPNKSFWSLNFKENYKKIFDQFETNTLNLPSYQMYLTTQKNYNDAVNSYKTQHNSFKYGFIIFCLFFSWLGFIVLWFKNYEYYKKLKENKLTLLKQVDKTKQACLIASEKYANEINTDSFIEEIYNLLEYKEIGPINQYLYKTIIQNSNLDLSSNNVVNPYKSSWGIWNKNKIVFNMSMQEVATTMRVYTGSIVVPTKNNDQQSFVTLTATYTHPFSDVIIYLNRYYAYIDSCRNLNFTFNKEKKLKFLNSKNNQLENETFNRTFLFDYNDPIQYRMIFTPHKQEMMINEYKLNKNKLALEDELNKNGHYLYSNYSTLVDSETFSIKANELLTKFKLNANLDIFYYLNKLEKTMCDNLEDLFKALKHLFTTPIMYSENHKTIINNALNEHKYPNYLPHYILNKIIKKEIIRYDSPCFNEIISNTTIKLNNDEFYCCVMDGLSYQHEQRIIYLPPDFHSKNISHQLVPVHYIDTIPYHNQMTFYYKPIESVKTQQINITINEIISKLTKTKQNNLNEIINEANKNNIFFYLKDNFIVARILNDYTYNENDIKIYFQDIIKILKTKQ